MIDGGELEQVEIEEIMEPAPGRGVDSVGRVGSLLEAMKVAPWRM